MASSRTVPKAVLRWIRVRAWEEHEVAVGCAVMLIRKVTQCKP